MELGEIEYYPEQFDSDEIIAVEGPIAVKLASLLGIAPLWDRSQKIGDAYAVYDASTLQLRLFKDPLDIQPE